MLTSAILGRCGAAAGAAPPVPVLPPCWAWVSVPKATNPPRATRAVRYTVFFTVRLSLYVSFGGGVSSRHPSAPGQARFRPLPPHVRFEQRVLTNPPDRVNPKYIESRGRPIGARSAAKQVNLLPSPGR